jgi:hypothetical protein
MAGLIQSTVEKVKQAVKGRKTAPFDRSWEGLPLEDKLSALYREYRVEDGVTRMTLNRLWFMSALYFQGKHGMRWNDQTSSLDIYEPTQGEDWYVENQFRQDVWANVKSLNAGELEPSAAPSSEQPSDVAAARVANSALDVIYEDIEYARLKTKKNLSLCLYGNAFVYNGFDVSPLYGTSLIPQYKYEQTEVPGAAICPQCMMTAGEGTMTCPECGAPMEPIPSDTIESKTFDKMEERPQGRNVSFVTTPLEMYARSKVAGGLRYQPYLFWVRRMDRNIVLDARPQALVGDEQVPTQGMYSDTDLSQYYIDVLSTLAGGPYSGTYQNSRRYYNEVEYTMCWIRPQMFRGDKELMRKFPDGVKFETCNGIYIKDTAENQSMDACWTHYAYFPNTYSFWADGMVDCLPIQDQINETNSLMIRYLRYCTMAKKLFDPNIIDPEELSNNPEEAWIKARPQLDKKLSDGVWSLEPTQLSQDVGRWKQDQKMAMQNQSGAFAASVGQSTGANASYSKQVFETERAQGRFAPMFDYNRPATVAWVRQLLTIFRDNAMDERIKRFIDNTGQWSFDKFTGSDLAQGSFDVRIPDNDSLPKSRVEKAQGLEMLVQLTPVIATLTHKEKAYIFDFIGLDPEASPETLQTQRAFRTIERLIKGEQITPLPFVDDSNMQVGVFQEYLAGESGDKLANDDPEGFAKVYTYMMTLVQMGMMQSTAMAPQPAPPGGPPKGQAPEPKPPEPEMAQAPIEQKIQMPPLPFGARSG